MSLRRRMKKVRGISELLILESFAIALNSLARPVRYYTKSSEEWACCLQQREVFWIKKRKFWRVKFIAPRERSCTLNLLPVSKTDNPTLRILFNDLQINNKLVTLCIHVATGFTISQFFNHMKAYKVAHCNFKIWIWY